MLRDLLDEPLMLGALIAGICLFGLGVYAAIQEQAQWQAFRAAHNCKVVGKIKGDVLTGVGPAIGGNGGMAVTVTATPDKTGWLCDDGMTYWR